jgi:dTDP-glucose 4,6-dehydratase
MMQKKVVLISGGAGFLGSHLCDWFIQHGFKVIAADNLLTGSLRNVAHLHRNKDFKFIKQDVSVAFKIAGRVDYVMHFASPASPVDYANHPIATMLVGSYGTHNMLEIARRKKAVFLMASTSEVYGDPLVHPQKESYWGNVNPNGPRSIYDEAKRYAEAAVFAYKRVYKMDVKVVRIFNTYGPRMQIKDGRVVPNFIDQILNHQPLTVYGNGKQTRSFCYVDDLVDGITKLLLSKISGPVNIGNPKEFTILEFAELIRKKYDPKARIIFHPLPVDDPKQRRPDISLARKELGWEPKVNLEEGIGLTMDWFARNLEHRRSSGH